jgi:hypothetical protein
VIIPILSISPTCHTKCKPCGTPGSLLSQASRRRKDFGRIVGYPEVILGPTPRHNLRQVLISRAYRHVRFAGFPHDENPVSRDVSAYTINSSKGALTAVGNFAAGLQSLAVAIAAPSPAVQIQNLITSTLITNLASNVQSQLDAKLNAAIRTLDAANNNSSSVAANQLQAFVNAVSADVQSGKITCTQATALVNAAQAIVAGLGQPPLIISLPC